MADHRPWQSGTEDEVEGGAVRVYMMTWLVGDNPAGHMQPPQDLRGKPHCQAGQDPSESDAGRRPYCSTSVTRRFC